MSNSLQSIRAALLTARVTILSKMVVAALLVALASPLCLWAQNTEATVLGTVKDPPDQSWLAQRSAQESRDKHQALGDHR